MYYVRAPGRGHLGLTRFANVPRGNVLFYVLRERRKTGLKTGAICFKVYSEMVADERMSGGGKR